MCIIYYLATRSLFCSRLAKAIFFFHFSVDEGSIVENENGNQLEGTTSDPSNSRMKRNAIIPEEVLLTNMNQNKKPRVTLNERMTSILGDPIDESENSQEISDESIQEMLDDIS